MILTFTNSLDATADFLLARVKIAGFPFVRLNTDQFTDEWNLLSMTNGFCIRSPEWSIDSSEISTLWFRRPKPLPIDSSQLSIHAARFSSREWTSALDGVLRVVPQARWINFSDAILGASSKPEQLIRSCKIGMKVPAWVLTSKTDAAIEFFRAHEECGVVAKPLDSGYVERENPAEDTVIYTSRVTNEDLSTQGPSLGCPTLFQQRIRPAVDVRVTVVDQKLLAVALTRNDSVEDIRRDNMQGVRYSIIRVPSDLQSQILQLVGSYSLRFAALDFLVTPDEVWWFLELNPNGQWAWLDLIGGATINELFLEAFVRDLATNQ